MILSLFYAILLAAGYPDFTSDPERIWIVRNESRLAINGESNVNNFRCVVDRYYNADNLHLHSSQGSDYLFSENRIVINLMEFDCGRNLITRDFRESLNARREPEMVINFLSLDNLPTENAHNEDLTGSLRITIAGATNEVQITFSSNNDGNGTTRLNGSKVFHFSDFGLEPPARMLGLIHVKNELEVSFDLVLEEIN
jgi:hypothetical protein